MQMGGERKKKEKKKNKEKNFLKFFLRKMYLHCTVLLLERLMLFSCSLSLTQ